MKKNRNGLNWVEAIEWMGLGALLMEIFMIVFVY